MSNPGGNFGPTTMAMGEENAQQTPPQNNPGAITRAVGEDMQGGVPSNPGGMQKMTMAIPENGQPQGQYTGAITRALGEEGNPPMPGGGQIMTTASPEGGQQLPMVTAALGETNQQPGMNNLVTTMAVGEESGQQPGSPGGW